MYVLFKNVLNALPYLRQASKYNDAYNCKCIPMLDEGRRILAVPMRMARRARPQPLSIRRRARVRPVITAAHDHARRVVVKYCIYCNNNVNISSLKKIYNKLIIDSLGLNKGLLIA